tara:strand:- start:1225 stop:1494 length:270 start_codon:yes stop_codon:yes gene_type:complete
METPTINSIESVCLDDKINSILLRLNKSGENYPNVSKLWKHYVKLRLELLENSLHEAENFLFEYSNLVDKDIPLSSLALLYALQFNNNN